MGLCKLLKTSAEQKSLAELNKMLDKKEKEVKKWSDKLFKAHKEDTSVRRRANLRINLDEACERRDEIERMIKYKEGIEDG